MKIIKNANRLEISITGFKSIWMGLVLTAMGFWAAFSFYNESKSLIPSLLSCLFAFAGIVLVFFSKNKSITLEKEGGATIVEKYLIPMGDVPKAQSIPTANIVAVNLLTYIQQNNDSDGNSTKTRESELSLLLKNNDQIKIEKSSGGFLRVNGLDWTNLITKAPLSNQAEQIAAFLGVPLKTSNQLS